jgi:hypothetical protein
MSARLPVPARMGVKSRMPCSPLLRKPHWTSATAPPRRVHLHQHPARAARHPEGNVVLAAAHHRRRGIIRSAGEGYRLTEAGLALAPVVRELARWATVTDSAPLTAEHPDTATLTWDIQRRIDASVLPARLVVLESSSPTGPPATPVLAAPLARACRLVPSRHRSPGRHLAGRRHRADHPLVARHAHMVATAAPSRRHDPRRPGPDTADAALVPALRIHSPGPGPQLTAKGTEHQFGLDQDSAAGHRVAERISVRADSTLETQRQGRGANAVLINRSLKPLS